MRLRFGTGRGYAAAVGLHDEERRTQAGIADRGLGALDEILLHGVLPGIGFLLTAWLWTSLSGTALIVGIVWAALGACYLLVITRFFRKAPPELDMRETDSLETIVR